MVPKLAGEGIAEALTRDIPACLKEPCQTVIENIDRLNVAGQRQVHYLVNRCSSVQECGYQRRVPGSTAPGCYTFLARMTNHFSLFRAVPMFSALTPDRLSTLIDSTQTRDFEAGEPILAEGELGNDMYLVVSGSIQVYTRGFNGEDIVLARLDAGQRFGEQALLSGKRGRRNASVRALRQTTCIVISREALFAALGEDTNLIAELQKEGEEQRVQRRRLLQDSIFGAMGIRPDTGTHQFRTFAPGEVVFRQGDPGDLVYLILSGHAKATRRDNDEKDEHLFAEISSGTFFGDRAIVNREPRWATVTAFTELETATFEAAGFLQLHDENTTVRSLTESLAGIYMLPNVGMMVLQTGNIDGEPVVITTHQLADTRRVVSTRVVGRASFVSRFVNTEASETLQWSEAESNSLRRLGILDGRIVSIYSEGEWLRLGEILSRMLSGPALQDWEILLFQRHGGFSVEEPPPTYEPRETLCACTKTTFKQVQDAIRQGCNDIPALAKKTGVTLVCGGCSPVVQDLLGRSDFTPANLVSMVEHGPSVRTFRIRPAASAITPFLPGQYIVVQSRIDGHWVQRAYTLSAPYTPGGDYEITVKREASGAFSRWLFDRTELGQPFRISAPQGKFCLPDPPASEVVCLTGGIGITPALAMARALVADASPVRFHVDYSVSEDADAICREELSGFPLTNPSISVKIRATSRDGRFGRSDVYRILTDSPDAVFYLCGSERFIEGITTTLTACGVPPEQIRLEAFTAAGEKPVAKLATAPVHTGGCPVPQGDHAAAAIAASPLEEALATLRQYYTESGSETALEARLEQVEQEFRTTGTYLQTLGELTFSAKLAWRNSVRCIGRLYWQGLTLRDFRHVRTGAEMLDAIMEHIELATNGGNVRPMMTVFPQEEAGRSDFRVWSQQLFRYAGYRLPDSSILGDPGNARFTEICMSLGWTPPEDRTAFDLLPIVVQAAGEKPVWRDVPRNLVMEALIVHPDFHWFAELGLKWYALPAVSCMLFDAGGVRYTAAPFNGWYMGTEIGARNFSDTYRYNLLPEIARRMGLDTSRETTLWRDRALVELNVAVLHSYEKAGITMMDHHTASQSFDRFEDIEKRAGREVYVKWSWVVPPISGSACTVFHREWQEVELKPMYLLQPDPWELEGSGF